MTTFRAVESSLSYLKLNASLRHVKELYRHDRITETELKCLQAVLDEQVREKVENTRQYNIKVAGFPFLKTLDDYDFDFQPTLNTDKIKAISESDFYQTGENIIFLGLPGTGKTHLSVALGISVASRRNSVYFIKFNKLITNLREAYHENRLDAKLKLYSKYKLLIIDEVGFNEISTLETKLFFQLIDLRYEKKSTIVTTNVTFDKWPMILGKDEMITKAILDRLLHHSYLFNISGPSYRLKDKIKPTRSGES